MSKSGRGKFGKIFAPVVIAGLAGLSLAACTSQHEAYDNQLYWPGSGVSYTVRAGDTMRGIAGSYNVTEQRLASYNALTASDRLYAGEVLHIPPEGYRAGYDVPAARPTIATASVTPDPRPAFHAAAKPKPRPRKYARNDNDRYADAYPDPRPKPKGRSDDSYYAGDGYAGGDPASDYNASYGPADAPRFRWPVNGRVLDRFGTAADGVRNDGINISTARGAPIRAAAGGTVIYSGNELKGYGNLLLIRHPDGYVTVYSHAERLTVSRDDQVHAGQIVGFAGDGEHPEVHFEIRHNTHPVDPQGLLLSRGDS